VSYIMASEASWQGRWDVSILDNSWWPDVIT
jgi:hypothetical protein